MKDANGSEDWLVLCELASKEKEMFSIHSDAFTEKEGVAALVSKFEDLSELLAIACNLLDPTTLDHLSAASNTDEPVCENGSSHRLPPPLTRRKIG
jgi:hypothetical protein